MRYANQEACFAFVLFRDREAGSIDRTAFKVLPIDNDNDNENNVGAGGGERGKEVIYIARIVINNYTGYIVNNQLSFSRQTRCLFAKG